MMDAVFGCIMLVDLVLFSSATNNIGGAFFDPNFFCLRLQCSGYARFVQHVETWNA
jgi:hypothetical protein